MFVHPGKSAAITGLALIALSLTGSTRNAANPQITVSRSVPRFITSRRLEAERLFNSAQYAEARDLFLAAARDAETAGIAHEAAIGWNSSGASSIFLLQFHDALTAFQHARAIAEGAHDRDALSRTLNNLATLYVTMGKEASALSVAREGLALPEAGQDAAVRAALRYQEAVSLANLGRFAEAAPIYRRSAEEFGNLGDLNNAARVLGAFGIDCLKADQLEESEQVLSRALGMARIHRLNAAANILRGLGRLRARQGNTGAAAALFQAALDVPQGPTPRWRIFADRGDFRLGTGDWQGALEDFRASRRLAAQLRADVVPADQDRIALEGGLNRVAAGLVEAGNQLATRAMNGRLVEETFAAAEQDRLWSLRALIPEANDWRTRLPAAYWEVLAHYQTAERLRLAKPSTEGEQKANALQRQLEQMEADAAVDDFGNRAPLRDPAGGELRHVQQVLDNTSVLFSFHIRKSGGWVWAADRGNVSVYRLPNIAALQSDAAALASAVQRGDSNARLLGQRLYRNLFGGVARSYLAHSRWLLELDGPLFDVPFAALITGDGPGDSQFLASRVALETIPSALMLQPRQPFRNGDFLGVGDPIYNGADARYQGDRRRTLATLPRLPATAPELAACAREWGAKSRLLTGQAATGREVLAALTANPAILHFATHVIEGPGEHASGLIALSLDATGSPGLLGPMDIVAHLVKTQLVVLNGCHSAQGEALPGAGLMGLTRAWIGAGADAVLATRWDIPDDAGKAVMVAFYRALRAHPEGGPAFALRQAQMELAAGTKWTPAVWAAYFLLAKE